MKNKPAFKNPFDLMEEDEELEPMSSPSRPEIKPTHQKKVISPLPFEKYDIQEEKKKQKKLNPEHKQVEKGSFTSPFSQEPSDSQQNQGSVGGESEDSTVINLPPISYQLDQNGDPPLLIDLGVEPQRIKQRILMILTFGKPTKELLVDPDLSGPIVIALVFGFLLLLAGKIHFGDIYAIFIIGNCLLYTLFNYMSQSKMILFYSIMSIMGYGLIPMLFLGVMGIFMKLKGVGVLVGLLMACWASYSAGGMMNVKMGGKNKNRQALVVYPVFLFYVSFAMIVIF